jgi:hypothetical protein
MKPYLKNSRQKRAGVMAQVVLCLHEGLSSNPSAAKKKKLLWSFIHKKLH